MLSSRSQRSVLPILGDDSGPEKGSFTNRLQTLRRELAELDQSAAERTFAPSLFDRLLKSTISLCPTCIAPVPALVFTRGGKVWMVKTCPAHGRSLALLEADENFYHLSNKDQWGRRYATSGEVTLPLADSCCGGTGSCGENMFEESGDFTAQMGNKTCTVLVEVTDACNLACAVCYSDAKGDRLLPLAEFERSMRQLIAAKSGLDSVQLTGGEAILHPEFWRMVEFLYEQEKVKKIYLPTNGIAFAKAEIAQRLVPFRDRVMVLLQFDGASRETNQALRNAQPVKLRQQALLNLGRLEIHTQLTMTVARGVNDHEIGEVIDTGFAHNHVKVIALQPVTYSGRYDLGVDPLERLTLSDVVKSVATQVSRRTRREDFVPIPCSHPNCGWITLFVRRFGLSHNIVRHVDLDQVMNQVANRTLLSSQELRQVVGSRDQSLLRRIGVGLGKKLIRSTDVFGIAIKPFMDRFSYDQDRVSACCHHLLDTHGRPVSFCEYNARIRPGDSWQRFPILADS